MNEARLICESLQSPGSKGVNDWSGLEDGESAEDSWIPYPGDANSRRQSRQWSLLYPSLPVNSGTLDIRLLRLLPGTFNQPVECTLETVSLEDRPSYEALSYTWGQATGGREVKVNGLWMNVTDNLWLALRRLRYTSHHRVLWIDALCINQSNLPERSQQVAVMDKIYSSACGVLIWLGDAELEMDDYLSSFRSAVETSIKDSTHWDLEDHKLRTFNDAITSMKPPWWTRVWIFQEFALASTEPSVCFGHYTISWSELMRLLDVVRQGSSNHAYKFYELNVKFNELGTIRDYAKAQSLSLDAIFLLTASMDATNPRDHIYSLRNLLQLSTKNPLVVDYLLTPKQVFVNATYHAIVSNGDCRILHLRQLTHRDAFRYETLPEAKSRTAAGDLCPSWMVDFSHNLAAWSFGTQPWKKLRLFSWSETKVSSLGDQYLSTPTVAHLEPDTNTLICGGFLMDTVRKSYCSNLSNAESFEYEKQISHVMMEICFALMCELRQDGAPYRFGNIGRARKLGDLIFGSLASSWSEAAFHTSMNDVDACFNYLKQFSRDSWNRALLTMQNESKACPNDESLESSTEITRRVFARLDLIINRRLQWHSNWHDPLETLWKDHIEEFSEMCNPQPQAHDVIKANKRRLPANISLSMKAVNPDLSFENLWTVDSSIEQATTAYWEYVAYCNSSNSDVHLYCTRAGFTGVGVGPLNESDVVVLLEKERCPMILRPTSGGYLFRGFTYIPIGEYLMDSEFERREFRIV